MVFLNKWGNVCLAYNLVFSSVVLSFIFIEKSLVMPIFLVFLGAYYLFLMTWYCVKLRKRKLFIYTLRVTGFLLLVIGIILGVMPHFKVKSNKRLHRVISTLNIF